MSALPPTQASVLRRRAWVDYAVNGDSRFLSHHDEIRAMTRAILRARWPLAYSGGFNPAPRLSIPLPRAVGVAADTQRAVVELTAACPATELESMLRAALPGGFELLGVVDASSCGKPHPVAVEYAAMLDDAERAMVAPRLESLLAAASRVVAREDRDGRKRGDVDIRPSIAALSLGDGELRMRLRLDGGAIARPHEVLAELGFMPTASIHRLRRTVVIWDTSAAERHAPSASDLTEVLDLAPKENSEEDRQEGGAEEDAATRQDG